LRGYLVGLGAPPFPPLLIELLTRREDDISDKEEDEDEE